MIKVPAIFQARHPFPYPKNNLICFEEWFFDHFTPEDDAISEREYLPIFWTGFLVRADFGKNTAQLEILQWFIDMLPKNKSYFSVCQYDDGTVVNLSGIDIKMFSMSGEPISYVLPLIYQLPETNFTFHKDIFCNLIARDTHPIRTKLFDYFEQNKNHDRHYYITKAHHEPKMFYQIIKRSVFTLAPRGYGATSFRILEAIALGSIPVYISDKFLIPHNHPFYNYGVLVHESKIDSIETILDNIAKDKEVFEKKQSLLPYIYNTYYTYEANKKLILEHVI